MVFAEGNDAGVLENFDFMCGWIGLVHAPLEEGLAPGEVVASSWNFTKVGRRSRVHVVDMIEA